MSQETCIVGQQVVHLSRPYQAPATPLVGREAELRLLTAAWIAGPENLPLSPLLLGEPGVGKNRLVYEVAHRTGKDLYIFQGHEDVTAEDLACAVRFSDDPNRRMDYVLSSLVTAMLRGGICFIDEIAKIRPRALALLVSVLDDRRYIDCTLLGERVAAHEGFRFVAATNTADLEGNALPEFVRSRMRPVIAVGYPPPEEISQIVRSRYARLHQQVGPLLDAFWSLWRQHSGALPPTPREVIHVFDLALNLADYALLARRSPFPLTEGGVAPLLNHNCLEQAFQDLYPRTPGRLP